jgi:large subunit ribosomal protein L25
MADMHNLDATVRSDSGTGAARQLRRDGRIPAVVYGGKGANVPVSVDGHELFLLLRTSGLMSLDMTVTIDGKAEQVKLQDVQVHPVTEQPLHLDFLRN